MDQSAISSIDFLKNDIGLLFVHGFFIILLFFLMTLSMSVYYYLRGKRTLKELLCKTCLNIIAMVLIASPLVLITYFANIDLGSAASKLKLSYFVQMAVVFYCLCYLLFRYFRRRGSSDLIRGGINND